MNMNKNNWKNKPNNNNNNNYQRSQYVKKNDFNNFQDQNYYQGDPVQQEDMQNFQNFNQFQNNGNNGNFKPFNNNFQKRNNSNYNNKNNYNNGKQNNKFRPQQQQQQQQQQYNNNNTNNFNQNSDFQNQQQQFRQKNQFQQQNNRNFNDNAMPEWILDDDEDFQFGTFDKKQFKQQLDKKNQINNDETFQENEADDQNADTFGNDNQNDFDPFAQNINASNSNQTQNSQSLEEIERQQQHQKQLNFNEQQRLKIQKIQDMADPNAEILKEDFEPNPAFKNNNKNQKQRKGSYNNRRKKSNNQMQDQQNFFMPNFLPDQFQNNMGGMVLPPGFPQQPQQQINQQNFPLFQNGLYNQQKQPVQNPFIQFSKDENLTLEEKVWKYKTGNNDEEHGPYPSEAMNQWLYEGYFSQPNLRINFIKKDKWVDIELFLHNTQIFNLDTEELEKSVKLNLEPEVKKIEDKTSSEITWTDIQEAQQIGGDRLLIVEEKLLGKKVVQRPAEKEGGFDTYEEMQKYNNQESEYFAQREKLEEIYLNKEIHHYSLINKQKEAIQEQNYQMQKQQERMSKNMKFKNHNGNEQFRAPPGFESVGKQQNFYQQQQMPLIPPYINMNFQQQQPSLQQTQQQQPQIQQMPQNMYGFQNDSLSQGFMNNQQKQQSFMPPGF